MTFSLQDQSWLINAPANFRELNKQLLDGCADLSERIFALANTRLDINQLKALSKTISNLNNTGHNLSTFSEFHLGIVGQSTTSLFADALPAAAARYGINLKTLEAEYDTVIQSALDASSAINTAELDAILVCLDHRALPFDAGIEAVRDLVTQIREGFARHSKARVIFQTLSCPPTNALGSFDRMHAASLSNAISMVNVHLIELAERHKDYILDVEGIASAVGRQNWHNPAQWNLYKLSYSIAMIPVHVDAIGRLLGAIRGRSRKCLVLDLDNTLWGGVIGDDELQGIVLGQGDPKGEAYLDVQRMALHLRNHGIVLAVCSKNDEENARLPFREHPDMLLKEDDIAVFMANWDDKVTNLRKIAQTLNISLDALVFVDDNPVEQLQVRHALPQVAVPALPEDVSYYTSVILNAGYFETVSFSDDDRGRANQYRDNARRKQMFNEASSLDDFLETLDMKLQVGSFDVMAMPRVTQLVNKTNQWNLTSRRYTRAEIEALGADPDVISLQARLSDKIGDNGVIAVLIARVEDAVCTIDSWLMSCRVIGRKVEDAMCAVLLEEAAKRGVETIHGQYIPTKKNALVADIYAKLGFEKLHEDSNGASIWVLENKHHSFEELPFKIEFATSPN